MVQVIIDADVSGVTDKITGDKVTKAIGKGIKYSAEELVRVLMINSPVDHGLLKQWFIDSIDDTQAVIKTPAEYAEYVNYGTRPHFIYPTNKKMLYWEGAEHPVPFVAHPGTTPTLFVENSIEDVENRMNDYFLKALEEVLG